MKHERRFLLHIVDWSYLQRLTDDCHTTVKEWNEPTKEFRNSSLYLDAYFSAFYELYNNS